MQFAKNMAHSMRSSVLSQYNASQIPNRIVWFAMRFVDSEGKSYLDIPNGYELVSAKEIAKRKDYIKHPKTELSFHITVTNHAWFAMALWLLLPIFRLFIKGKKQETAKEKKETIIDFLKRKQFVDHGDFWRKGFVKVVPASGWGGEASVGYYDSSNRPISFSSKDHLEEVLEYLKKFDA